MGAAGGEGAAVSETVPVTPGAQLTVGVAGNAADCQAASGAGAGGVGGGGTSGTGADTGPSGGGGGASLVSASGAMLIVAGGGGGATDGNSRVNGGNAGSPGADGGFPGTEGQPGTQTAGGAGGAAESGDATDGSPGGFLVGGTGGSGESTPPSLGGPGGGAGYYGGGGAGGSATFTNTGGGGGGSSYTAPGASAINGPTVTTAAPKVVIYYIQPAPAATTGAASGVSVTKATLNGIVNPESLPTTYQFQYGTTTAYGHTTTVSSAGSGGSTVNASAVLSSLKPNTKYHFRIVASSASGATVGADMTLKTKRRPSIKLHPRKVHPGNKLHISGSAGGCVAHRVILISRAFGASHSFAGVPAVYAKVKKSSGTYSVTTTIPANLAAGRYAITARCGGGNLGVRAHLRVL